MNGFDMKIFYVYNEEWDCEGFFNENGNCLASWSLNDAKWRSEYMDSLLTSLGYEIIDSSTDELLINELLTRFGY
jgi:hypothetical protein